MNILYVCTHNRCRSILSEAITNHLASSKKIQAFSAGSQPVGQVHPYTIKFLKERNIPSENLVSKSWDRFKNKDIDLVITVCDNAAQEACPLWVGDCTTIHWGLNDPSKIDGDEEEIRKAFHKVINQIEERVKKLAHLIENGSWSTRELEEIAHNEN